MRPVTPREVRPSACALVIHAWMHSPPEAAVVVPLRLDGVSAS